MITKQFEIPGVPRQELDLLEDVLENHLKRTDRFEHAGLRTDPGTSEYPFAEVDAKYGITHLLSTTPAIDLEARGQVKEGPFALKLGIQNLPEDVYERITGALEKAPTIHAYFGQSYAGK